MQKIILLSLILLIYLFLWQLNYGSGGYIDNEKLIQQINQQIMRNQKLSVRDNYITIKLNALKGSVDALEGKIRRQFNMIQRNETLIILPNDYVFKPMPKK